MHFFTLFLFTLKLRTYLQLLMNTRSWVFQSNSILIYIVDIELWKWNTKKAGENWKIWNNKGSKKMRNVPKKGAATTCELWRNKKKTLKNGNKKNMEIKFVCSRCEIKWIGIQCENNEPKIGVSTLLVVAQTVNIFAFWITNSIPFSDAFEVFLYSCPESYRE